jgi:N-acetylglucosamine-6-sulfatase
MRSASLLAAAAGCALAVTLPTAAGAATRDKPNVVVVMTDDQRADDIVVMPKTRKLLGGAGTTYPDSYVSYPLCCPSRATFLTGQYAHNHGVTWNFAPFGGYERFKALGQQNTLPVWLQRAGYHTGLIGKYLNEYGEQRPTEVPPGWDDWQGSVDPTTYLYYGYTLNDNGRLVTYGNEPGDYMTDVYAERASRFIRRNAPGRKPFFLWVTPNAPHTETNTGRAEGSPAVPAPRHANDFANAEMGQRPNYDEEDISDKAAILQRFLPLSPEQRREGLDHWRGRRGSLLAVDDLVEQVVGELRAAGELENTVIVFTSDNGWLIGEHRVLGQKYFGFEESIKVPLLVRGPGFERGASRAMALNVDLAPTIAKAAGARMGRPADGIPLQESREGDRDMLVETGPNTPGLPYYSQLHTRRWVYEEISTGERELYDLRTDPFELENRADHPAYAGVVDQLSQRLARLKECRGRACHSAGGSPEAPR